MGTTNESRTVMRTPFQLNVPYKALFFYCVNIVIQFKQSNFRFLCQTQFVTSTELDLRFLQGNFFERCIRFGGRRSLT